MQIKKQARLGSERSRTYWTRYMCVCVRTTHFLRKFTPVICYYKFRETWSFPLILHLSRKNYNWSPMQNLVCGARTVYIHSVYHPLGSSTYTVRKQHSELVKCFSIKGLFIFPLKLSQNVDSRQRFQLVNKS